MKVLRFLALAVLAVALVLGAVAVGARFADGPFGPLPGGALRSGEWVEAPVGDWSFATDVAEIELQLESQERSRTTWILVHDGAAFVPASVEFPPGKTWHTEALEDGRARIRVEGKRYPVALAKIDDPALETTLGQVVEGKYPTRPPDEGGAWFFSVTSRAR